MNTKENCEKESNVKTFFPFVFGVLIGSGLAVGLVTALVNLKNVKKELKEEKESFQILLWLSGKREKREEEYVEELEEEHTRKALASQEKYEELEKKYEELAYKAIH